MITLRNSLVSTKHDHVREAVDELATHDTALDRGDRCRWELFLVRDTRQYAIDLDDELETETITLRFVPPSRLFELGLCDSCDPEVPHGLRERIVSTTARARPAGMNVLVCGNIDIPANTVISLHVPAGASVTFADVPATYHFTNIVVDGRMSLGSPTCRLESAINIVFDTTEDVSSPTVRTAIYNRMGLGIMVGPTARSTCSGICSSRRGRAWPQPQRSERRRSRSRSRSIGWPARRS